MVQLWACILVHDSCSTLRIAKAVQLTSCACDCTLRKLNEALSVHVFQTVIASLQSWLRRGNLSHIERIAFSNSVVLGQLL
jgi:hypothetical protein